MTRFRTALKCSLFALALAPLPAMGETALVYVTNSAGDHVDVVNSATDKVIQQIPIEGAHGINFAPDGSRVYVSNESTSTLDVFDQKAGKLLKKVVLSNHPNNIAVAKDGRILVGIARGQGALDIIDPVKLEVVKTIPTHGRLHNIYTTKDGKYVITGSVQTGVFTVIDLQKQEIVWEHKFDHGVRPMTIESNPDGSAQSQVTFPTQPYTRSPTWLPDGSLIFGFAPPLSGAIYVRDLASGSEANLADGREPLWSPEGTRIAFVADSTGSGFGGSVDIYVMDPSGEALTTVGEQRGDDGGSPCEEGQSISWAPDDGSIAYSDGVETRISLVDVEAGTAPVVVATRASSFLARPKSPILTS